MTGLNRHCVANHAAGHRHIPIARGELNSQLDQVRKAQHSRHRRHRGDPADKERESQSPSSDQRPWGRAACVAASTPTHTRGRSPMTDHRRAHHCLPPRCPSPSLDRHWAPSPSLLADFSSEELWSPRPPQVAGEVEMQPAVWKIPSFPT